MESGYQNALAEVTRRLPVNVAPAERLASIAGGAFLVASGLRRGGLVGALGALAGGGLLFRGLTGRCGVYAALGVNANEPSAALPESCATGSGARPPVAAAPADTGDAPDLVDEASMESFPASDPPAYSPQRH